MLRSWIKSGLQHVVEALSEERTLFDFSVVVSLGSDEEPQAIYRKVEDALSLVERFSPRDMRRLRRYVNRFHVWENGGRFLGSWNKEGRVVALDYPWVLRADIGSEVVAATMVHEGTHAWLDALGFSYRADRRARLEAICYRAQAAFVRRLPNSAALVAHYEERVSWALSVGDNRWSDEWFRERDARALDAYLRECGVPGFAAEALSGMIRPDSA